MTEFEKFDTMMKKLIRVPHGELKAKLDAEKSKKQTKRKTRKSSASDREARERG